MSDSGYTPSMERVEDLFAWAVAWDAGKHEDRPDLAKLQVQQRAEFQRALAAHDAVIREDERQKAIDTIRFHRGGYNRNGSSHKLLLKMEDAILSQSFTGTESEQNG